MATTVTDDHLASVLGDWADEGHGGLARRLANALRCAIEGGVLPDGVRLPPERQLATLLSVSRSTVTTALDELRGEGVVRSRQGQGTVVVGPGDAVVSAHRVGTHFANRGTGIDLAAVVPTDGSHLPHLCLKTEDLVAARGHLEPNGIASLRTALAARHTTLGRHTEPQEIQVTHGAHHAIGLILAAVVPPGGGVAVEHYSYPGILDLIDHQRTRAVPLPSDAGGPDPEALERVLAAERPAAVYLQAGVHNPTGYVIGPGRRRAIAAVLDRHPDTVVIEDNTLADIVFEGRPRPSFAELCRAAPVATVESLSKTAWAALRIGWIRSTGLLNERIARVRTATDLGASVPSQLLALQLVEELDELAARRRVELRASVQHALDRVATDLPDWSIEPPLGSSALWPQLPVSDATPFVALARRHGVHVTSGSAHLVDSGPDPHLRFCVDRPRAQVDEGITRLAAAWHEARSSHRAMG